MSKDKKRLMKALKEIEKCEKIIDSDDSTTREMIKAMFKALKVAYRALHSKGKKK